MRILDRVLGWFLVLLGCVHNFVAAPASFAVLDERALWFVAGGLALWYAGFLNLLRAHAPPGGPGRKTPGMVGAPGFEPGTLCSQSRCATGLRYSPTLFRPAASALASGGPGRIRTRDLAVMSGQL